MSQHRCPYCGSEDEDEDHIMDCQPFTLGS